MKMINIPEHYMKTAKSGADLSCNLLHNEYLQVSERTCRRRLAEYRKSVRNKNIESLFMPVASCEVYEQDVFSHVVVYTAAQSGTELNKEFWSALNLYKKERKARLVVGGIKYNYTDVYSPEIEDYLSMERDPNMFHKLDWCGEMQILPTAVDPLAALDSYTIGNSGIFPHTKVRLKSLPSIIDEPRFHYTTGCVTVPNYTNSKAGNKAKFHHVNGALVVEYMNDGTWFARHIIADSTGGFYDLDKYYSPCGKITKENRVEAITFGDVHFPNQHKEFFNWYKSMLEALKPKHVFLHDVYDFNVKNHHNINNFQHNMRVPVTIMSEWNDMILDVVRTFNDKNDSCVWIIPGNHGAAFDKWLNTAYPQTNPADAKFIIRCLNEYYNGLGNYEDWKSIFAFTLNYAIQPRNNVTVLDIDENIQLFFGTEKPIECGVHGNYGTNGSQGSPTQFTKIGRRINLGHTHTAQIIDGVYCAGTSTPMDMGYNHGPSTWSNSHILVYKNGKRCICTCVGEKWHG